MRGALAIAFTVGLVGCFGFQKPGEVVDASTADAPTDAAGSGSAAVAAGSTGADDGVAMLGLGVAYLVCGLRLTLRYRRRARIAAAAKHEPAWAMLVTQAGIAPTRD